MARQNLRARVLVVDHDGGTTTQLQQQLEQWGAEVSVVGTAMEALAQLEPAEPRVLIVSRDLPDGDGLDLVAKVQRRYPAVAAILISDRPDLETAVEALERGAVGYLCKPLTDSDRLRDRLEAAVLRAQEQAALVMLQAKYRKTSDELEGLRLESEMVRDVVEERVSLAQRDVEDELAERDARIVGLCDAIRREEAFIQTLERRLSILFGEHREPLRDVLQELSRARLRLAEALGDLESSSSGTGD